MGKGRRFDKKSAKTYSIVHRAHDDSLYFDNDSPAQVLVEKPQKRLSTKPDKKSKAYTTSDLVQKLNSDDVKNVRENEGLAAQYGIFFDDSNYDYMQHLRPIGQAPDSVFIEATKPEKTAEKTKKAPKNIEDLIKDVLPSEKTRKVTHDEYDSIPHELKKFNPDLDPRLREVLVALEDEAYVENEAGDGDIFDDLLKSGEADEHEFYEGESEFDEWDMDNFQDEFEDYGSDYEPEQVELENPYNDGEAPEDFGGVEVDNAWEKDFKRFERSRKNQVNDWDSDNEFESEEDVVGELPTIEGKKKPKTKLRKKMGAMTDTSAFSMSSSALFRSEGLTLLDDRFESYSKKFEEEEEEEEKGDFDMKNERPDFEDMLDDFLDTYELESGGRKLAKKDQELEKIKNAADSVSKGKVAQRRRKDGDLGGLGSSFGKLQL